MICSGRTIWPKGRCDRRGAEMLTPMLEDPQILKIGQNMKYDAKIFAQVGIELPHSMTRC